MATPLPTRHHTGSDAPRDDGAYRAILELIRGETRALCGWALLIGASLLGFWLSEGTSYHQLAVGILMSSTTLFVLIALFEGLWRLFDRTQA